MYLSCMCMFFFFNDTPTSEIYTFPYTTLFRSERKRCPLPSLQFMQIGELSRKDCDRTGFVTEREGLDRKSTRLNSSHSQISYAVFCLKKKKNKSKQYTIQTLYNIITHIIGSIH